MSRVKNNQIALGIASMLLLLAILLSFIQFREKPWSKVAENSSPSTALTGTPTPQGIVDGQWAAHPPRVGIGHTLRIRVVDISGAPIDRAIVQEQELSETQGTQRLTDDLGQCELPILDIDSTTVVANKKGYAQVSASVSGESKSPITLVLVHEQVLAGSVTMIGTQQPVKDCWVLCFPRAQPAPSFIDVLSSVAEWPKQTHNSFLLTRTDNAGAFAFNGPFEEDSVCLLAGKPDCCSRAVLVASTRIGNRIDLVVQREYGAILSLRDGNGKQPLVSNRISPGEIIREASSEEFDAQLISGNSLVGALAGFQDPPGLVFPSEIITLFASAEDAPALGPVRVVMDLPGYQSVTIEYMITPTELGLKTTDVTLNQACEDWNDVRVRFISKNPQWLEKENLPKGIVYLQDRAGHAYSFSAIQAEVEWTITGIPTGQYKIGFRSLWGGYHYSPEGDSLLTVSKGGEPAHFDVDLSEMGVVTFSVLEHNGQPFRGSLQFMASVGDPELNAAGHRVFRGAYSGVLQAPFHVLSGLSAGRFTISYFEPCVNSPHGTTSLPMSVDVAAGKVTNIKLVRCE